MGVATDTTVDDSGVSSDRYDHAGNLGFVDNTSHTQASLSTQVTPQAPPPLTRAESYAERTNQLGLALLSPATNMRAKPGNGALGIDFDSFFSPATDRPVLLVEPRYGEVSSERLVKVGHSQETLATAYVTASESGVSPSGGQRDSPGAIPEESGSRSTLHSQVAELDVVVSPALTVGDLQVAAREVSPTRSLGVSDQSLSVEYGRADRSLRTLDSFPAMLRGSLSCFPEDVSLNTPVLPSIGSELNHREAYDIMLLPADDLTQGCLVLTRAGDDSAEHERNMATSDGISFMVAHEASNLVARSEEDSILSPDLSEHAVEQADSIISHDHMRSSIDSIVSGRRADRSSNGLKFAAQLFLSSDS
ncbi:unnamed protein product [Rhizoctonia solani]|uniref:Uncharacterized protein n=1 Tax=Rhizoctonia solani TaxID=456999 RepID=A0A8H3HSZ5_9AGAM|nr:unnamed protein product [Rhizoctonia solani]